MTQDGQEGGQEQSVQFHNTTGGFIQYCDDVRCHVCSWETRAQAGDVCLTSYNGLGRTQAPILSYIRFLT